MNRPIRKTLSTTNLLRRGVPQHLLNISINDLVTPNQKDWVERDTSYHSCSETKLVNTELTGILNKAILKWKIYGKFFVAIQIFLYSIKSKIFKAKEK